jgi:proline dehydrogenase
MASLAERGYEVGLEVVGENAQTVEEVRGVEAAYLALIAALPAGGLSPRTELNFDLSNVGLLISSDLAREVTHHITTRALERGLFVTISMERTALTSTILDVFDTLARGLPNLGITLQAYLHRTADDLERVLASGRRVRLVKGAYDEAPELAVPRGRELDERYLALARRLHRANVPRSYATHDAALIARLRGESLLAGGAEVEMLHGVAAPVLRALRSDGVACRIYGAFGTHWWLHFVHRLAEHLPNVATAFADIASQTVTPFGEAYR